MNAEYPAAYQDKHGEISTSIHNDGRLLTMIVRGVTFQGDDFDSLEPTDGTDLVAREQFTINHDCLCSCVIEAKIPVPVTAGDEASIATLAVELELGDPAPNGGIDREVLTLALQFGDETLRSSGQSGGWFEDEMLDIQGQLPDGTYMKACINCALSDYSPYGHGLFGGMACFRDNKKAYLAVNSKDELFAIWDSMTEFVQETFVCSDFERRRRGAGYRG